jgi:putative ABC transport system permease protein
LQNQFGILLKPVLPTLFFGILFSIVVLSLLINGILPALLINRFTGLKLLQLKT